MWLNPEIIDHLVNTYNNNNIDDVKNIISNSLSRILNNEYLSNEGLILRDTIAQHMNTEIAEYIINNVIISEKLKNITLEQFTALFFKYKKYEDATNLIFIFTNYLKIENVIRDMIKFKVDNKDIKGLFEIYDDLMENMSYDNNTRQWIMAYAGLNYNIDIIYYLNIKLQLTDYDIENIILNMISNSFTMTNNHIKLMFENYYLNYNYFFIFNLLRELHYKEYNDLIDYVLKKSILNFNYENMNEFEQFVNKLFEFDQILFGRLNVINNINNNIDIDYIINRVIQRSNNKN